MNDGFGGVPQAPTGPAHIHADSYIQGIDDEVAGLTISACTPAGQRAVAPSATTVVVSSSYTSG